MEEVWKWIPNYEGTHQASNLGRIRSVDRVVPVKGNKEEFSRRKGRIMKQFTHPYGYKILRLCREGKCTSLKVHRLVLAAFKGYKEDLPYVNHIDGNKSNNNLDNLEWCTASYNQKHAYNLGLRSPIKGEDKKDAKLTLPDIVTIWCYLLEGFELKPIAEYFGVSLSTISHIRTKRNWK